MDSHKFTSLTHAQHSWVKRTMVFLFLENINRLDMFSLLLLLLLLLLLCAQ